MDERKQAHFRQKLEAALAALDRGDARGAQGQKTVMLDQQAVGRLSRMDALQQQAMAQATQARRNAERARIMAALARFADGEYGYCVECGDAIEEPRLELDPSTPKCLDCARG
ncbi:RNA polymerase-binding transcription factor DksA [Pseudoruegeria aquimaris]|uniref:RNA polymerase-binding transcription factor DksA n=1 Tax=Pseudoruegeria aquimaris TaxID=393663 RepID=A0A1Y5RNJ4_9RHOB|nr:TraR/DksA C4-type zinc finger protein [Pseudoruegeria aquimaris]SLN21774.1 RNA polymerase-binding transcription factor DksA [Pseudoruegeria aquimaris]